MRPPQPETVWHITTDGRPATPGAEGFVHASFTGQLKETLAVHYPDAPRVELLRLDRERLGDRLVIEPSRGGALFPHIYGEVEDQDVAGRAVLVRTESGEFPLDTLAGASE